MIQRRALLTLMSGAALLTACGQIGPRRGTTEVMSINGFLTENDIVFLSGVIDESAPERFAQLRAANPGITTLVIAEASGAQGNAGALALGRAVRAAGLTTELRSDSVAIGAAADVFLAGVSRGIQEGAVLRMRGRNLDRDASYKAYLTEMAGAEFAAFVESGLSRLRARDLRLHEIQRYGLVSGTIAEAFGAQN